MYEKSPHHLQALVLMSEKKMVAWSVGESVSEGTGGSYNGSMLSEEVPSL